MVVKLGIKTGRTPRIKSDRGPRILPFYWEVGRLERNGDLSSFQPDVQCRYIADSVIITIILIITIITLLTLLTLLTNI